MAQEESLTSGGRFWQVQEGDTLYRIALETGTTVQQLMELNPTVSPENLTIGSLLRLPVFTGLPSGPIPPCESGFFWVVAPGDTLYLIAQETDTTVEILMRLNPDIEPLNLMPGQSICLPQESFGD